MHAPSGNRVAIVAAESVVVRIRQIKPAQMSVTVDANIANLDRVRPHVADQSRPHQKSIAIEFAAGPIVVVKRARLNCVALLNKVLKARKNLSENIILAHLNRKLSRASK